MEKVVLLLALLFCQLTVKGNQRQTACRGGALSEYMSYKQGVCAGNGRTMSSADSLWVVSVVNDTVAIERAKEKADSVRTARGKRMINGRKRAPQSAHEGFEWQKLTGAGVSLMVLKNDRIRLIADPMLPGIVMVRDSDAVPRRLIRVFDIKSHDINDVIDVIKNSDGWDDAQTCKFKLVDSGRQGVSRYVMIPDGEYAKVMYERMKSEPVASTCNGWGLGNSGYRYFEMYDGNPGKVVFVEIGQDAPLFDEKSIEFAADKKDDMSMDVLYTMKGTLCIGHEVRSFRPEGLAEEYWIVDKTGKLEDLYDEITGGQKSGVPVKATLKLEYNGKWDTGFAEDYDGVFFVREIVDVKKDAGENSSQEK